MRNSSIATRSFDPLEEPDGAKVSARDSIGLGHIGDAPSIAYTAPPEGIDDAILSRMALFVTDVFPALSTEDLRAIAAACSWFSVPGGSCVFRQGDESDAIFFVASGMLGSYRIDPSGRERLLGRIGAGEIAGEMGFVTKEPRTATVKALRNSELLRVSRTELQELEFRYPTVLMELCNTVVRRLRNAQERRPAPLHAKTFCIVPLDRDLDGRMIAEHIARVSATGSHPLVLTREEGEGNTADWFFQREQSHGVVIYLAEADPGPWTRFCLRQADGIVLLARGGSGARPFPALGPGHAALPSDIPTDLILLWDRPITGADTSDWLDLIRPRAHHHVRSPADGARAARLIAGRSVGLVLSGGGARGLAHVGVAQALREHGIAVDVIGGTSIGAIIGAGLALEWDLDAMTERCIGGLLRRPLFSDLGISRAALFPGRKVKRLFSEWFGGVAIEETPIRYFCVSTDLSRRRLGVHTAGKLANWVQASAAIPGVYPPVVDEGAVHVDGGVLDNLPVDAMQQFGVASIIAVNVGAEQELIATERPPGVLELLRRVGSVGSDSKASSGRSCDVLLVPKVQHIGLLNWRSYEEAVRAGYRATIECMPALELIARA
jgi:NTE family protein